MTNLEAIFPVNRHALYTKHRYPAATRSDDLLFVSGHAASRTDGSAEPDYENEPDYEKQEALAFDDLIALPKAAGCSLNDVVDVTSLHTDGLHTDPATRSDTIFAVRDRFITDKPFPNWAAVSVNWLAGFVFEITVIARVPQAA